MKAPETAPKPLNKVGSIASKPPTATKSGPATATIPATVKIVDCIVGLSSSNQVTNESNPFEIFSTIPEISKFLSMISPIRPNEVLMESLIFSNAPLIPPVTRGNFSNPCVIVSKTCFDEIPILASSSDLEVPNASLSRFETCGKASLIMFKSSPSGKSVFANC